MPPDLRDGLDETGRRVLARLTDRRTKCAKLVDDEDEYDALAALAQPWRMRHPLVDGYGNFGSPDSDPPADPEYTEARLAPPARELERFPNLLVNGSATIPPHNLREVAAAIADPDSLPGPDFPTGGVIPDPERARAAYATGHGTFRLRGRAHKRGDTLVVTELPYGVDKGGEDGWLREIIELMVQGDLPRFDPADHSDREMRIVLGTPEPHALLAALYAHTRMEVEIGVDLVALVDGEPRRLTLPELLDRWLAGRDPATVARDVEALAARWGDDRRTTLGDGR
jgi:DNA gyrase subunit A